MNEEPFQIGDRVWIEVVTLRKGADERLPANNKVGIVTGFWSGVYKPNVPYPIEVEVPSVSPRLLFAVDDLTIVSHGLDPHLQCANCGSRAMESDYLCASCV